MIPLLSKYGLKILPIMSNQGPIAPFILRPSRIYNFTQLIAMLRLKQKKYKKYSCKPVTSRFSDILDVSDKSFDYNMVIEGYLHEKLRDKCIEQRDRVCSDFDRFLAKKIKEIKEENDHKVYRIKMGNISEVEELFFVAPSKITFRDDLLYDLYVHLQQRREPLDFLHNSFLGYMQIFMSSHNYNADTLKIPALDSKTTSKEDAAIKSMVTAFVKLRYNQDELSIESYDGRYLWAELYVLYRVGRIRLVKQLLTEFSMFFELASHRFKTTFLDFLNNKSVNCIAHVNPSDDKFKRFFISLFEGKPHSDGAVINTVEDYLWMMIISRSSSKRDISRDLSGLENPKTQFMVYIIAKKYKKAIEVVLKSEFNIIAKFFLLRELCLEQGLDIESNQTEGGFRATASTMSSRPLLKNIPFIDESSSACSLASAQSYSGLSYFEGGLNEVNPIFLNFFFNIASQFSTNERRVRFIEMLKNYGDYYTIVPRYIIKHEMFDIIGKKSDVFLTGNLEYVLDAEITKGVIENLKNARNKKKLIQLYKFLADDTMVNLLVDVLEEAIMLDEPVDCKIIDEYVKKKEVKGTNNLANLYSLYKFNSKPSLDNLRGTIIFGSPFDLSPYKFVIEKILPRAIEIIKVEAEKDMARCIFRMSGQLDLNEECCKKITQDLSCLI